MAISKALVVDDSRLARVALSKMLTRRGLHVDTADCGGDAIEFLRSQSPDVVFLDYMMPDMDGFEAAEAINRLRGERALPLVMYTSQDSDEDRRRARELGICGFLSKPTSDQGLDAVLQELSRWRPPEPAANVAVVPEPEQVLSPEPVQAAKPEPMPEAAAPSADPAPMAASQEMTQPPASGLDEAAVRDIAVAVVHERVRELARDVAADVARDAARDVADTAEQRLQAALAALDERWRGELDKTGEDWRDGLKGFGDSVHEAATEAATLAAQQSSERLAAETEQSLLEQLYRLIGDQKPAAADTVELEQRLREQLLSEARAAAEEVAAPIARQNAGVTATEVSREMATRVAEESARRVAEDAMIAMRESMPDAVDDIDQRAVEAVTSAIAQLTGREDFRAQVLAAVGEHAVPRLKNQLDHWVEERARNAVDHLVAERLERTVDAMVREAVAASAEAAAREAHALHARSRRQINIAGAMLGAGVVTAMVLAFI
ncbi:CheY-like chemotaxis protein [Natronocella acetinitrilica]|uniref:CheY-like chemotaxis protein n=1 Tax=Natronocella acetinitrilica TaxID=414046 RepID=A0AAE3KB26_9GAMM|nr:response regulator [Natronocella acetinitrilica]MCP1673098.1 CheY-like chemotaxis protein [Natronocella acetinitrilica]